MLGYMFRGSYTVEHYCLGVMLKFDSQDATIEIIILLTFTILLIKISMAVNVL